MIDGAHWYSVKDGDPRAYALYLRHYSQKRTLRQRLFAVGDQGRFAGIGERMILLSSDESALFVWRIEKFRKDNQMGVNCSIFRNEGPTLSSELIREADDLAWQRWPDDRHWTYVNPSKIRSVNPGACFKKAGYVTCGTSKGGLVILEKWREKVGS